MNSAFVASYGYARRKEMAVKMNAWKQEIISLKRQNLRDFTEMHNGATKS